MSDLQIGLFALGAIVVVGVLAFNKWQETKYRRSARSFESGHADVLLGRGAPPPPVVEHDAMEQDAVVEQARVEPRWLDTSAADGAGPARVAGAGSAGFVALDPRIDYVAELQVEDAMPGKQVATALQGLERVRHVDCDGLGPNGWEHLNPDSAYEKVRIGIQLSDRSGPLKSNELAAFRQSVEGLAAQLEAAVDWPATPNPLSNAAELDAYCADVDVQIGISLVAGAPFADTKLRGLAEANGFVRDDDGVFRRRDDAGVELLCLRQSAPAAVAIVLDVPRVPKSAAAFGLMMHCARTIAKGLEARMVDDAQRPLDDAKLARIGQEIAGIQSRMEAAGLPAGGTLALRLFA